MLNGTPTPLPFDGILDGNLSPNVLVSITRGDGDSTATNTPRHVGPGHVVRPPAEQPGVVVAGSATVFINKRAAARDSDAAKTCNDPVDLPVGHVVASSTVIVGRMTPRSRVCCGTRCSMLGP